LAFAPQGHFHYFENASELRTLFVIVLDGSKEPKGESGIVHSLKAKPPYARAAVFGGCSPASAIDRTICKRSRRAVSFTRLDGMINSGDSAERWHAPGSTAAGGGFKSV
jgi:hypothetical protein